MDKDLQILEYYDKLAAGYDKSRFENSYGKFIHKRESQILRNALNGNDISKTLDLACGTGRFMEFADHGIDISPKMIDVARKKFDKDFRIEDAENLSFNDGSLATVFSLHMVMHLSKEKSIKVFNEVHRILQQGGKFIFDIPSSYRRNLKKRNSMSWHGSNSYSLNEIKETLADDWIIEKYYGLLFLPVHRFPKVMRKLLIIFDKLLCASFLKEYSSYLIIVLRKK